MKKIIPIIFCLFLINLVLLTAISYPHGFYGTAKYENGADIPDGYIITGEINWIITGSCVVSNGRYDLVVVDEIGDGGEVKFYIQGEEADQTSTFETFEATELDLTIESNLIDDNSEFCGDGSCNNGETCSSCSIDCSSCSDDNSGNNGGGGGSGDLHSNTITQTTDSDGTINLNLDTIDELNNANENQESTSSGFTGSVIGFVKSSGGIATGVILLIGLIGGIAFFNFKKGKSVKEITKNSLLLIH